MKIIAGLIFVGILFAYYCQYRKIALHNKRLMHPAFIRLKNQRRKNKFMKMKNKMGIKEK